MTGSQLGTQGRRSRHLCVFCDRPCPAGMCVFRCFAAAVEGAEAEHAARRRLITRVLQDVHSCLEVSEQALWTPHRTPCALLHRAKGRAVDIDAHFVTTAHTATQQPACCCVLCGCCPAGRCRAPA